MILCKLERLNLLESVTTMIRSATSHIRRFKRAYIFIMCADAALQIDRIYTKKQHIEVVILQAIAQPDRRKKIATDGANARRSSAAQRLPLPATH